MNSKWRDEARKVILKTLATLPPDATLQEKRKALREAYPFGPRQYHPYKIWCDEVRVQLGLKRGKKLASAECKTPLFPTESRT